MRRIADACGDSALAIAIDEALDDLRARVANLETSLGIDTGDPTPATPETPESESESES